MNNLTQIIILTAGTNPDEEALRLFKSSVGIITINTEYFIAIS